MNFTDPALSEILSDPLWVEFEDADQSEINKSKKAGRREDLNGKLIMSARGTVWIVMDGVARGYRKEPLFARVHGWSRKKHWCGIGPDLSCRWVNVKTSFIKIPDIDISLYVEEGPPIAYNATLIRNVRGTIFFYEDNLRRGIPSPSIMDKYQFNWKTAKSNLYIDDVIHAIPSGPNIE